MDAETTNQAYWPNDGLFFLDRLTRSDYAGQQRLFHWLLKGGFPPAAIQGRECVFQGMSPRERRQFKLNAARLIRVPRDGAAVVPE